MTYKRFSFLFFVSFNLLTAQQNPSINIKPLLNSKSNFRAIAVLNDSTVWFANSSGKVGQVSINKSLAYYTFKDSFKKHFRAIGSTKDALFALTIESPARLYKFTKNDFNQPAQLVYSEKHPKAFYDAMHFLDNKIGIAMGDPTDKCLSIITTNDGGNSWYKKLCANLPKSFDGEAAFAASNTNIATYKNTIWIATGGLKSRIFISKNKGRTFKVYNTPFIQGKSTTGIYTMAFYNAKNGFICGGDYTDKNAEFNNKALTTNGGKTWQIVANNTLPGYISCVQYIPNSKGKKLMAVSTEGIYYSKNAGKKWDKLSDKGFYTIRFADKNTAFLGGRGTISILELTYKND